jgi:hypothetical protein
MSATFSIGDTVRLIALPAYVKTAEPKPMLRPPQVILMEAQYLAAVAND